MGDEQTTYLVDIRFGCRSNLLGASELQYDQVLATSSTQADVYHAAVKPVVTEVLNGYNGTILAYGQTGAGKTYTLSSVQPNCIGMMPRAASEIFEYVRSDPVHSYTVIFSYIQIYMEQVLVSNPA